MGAYYTKEDITEYISKNTILPFLLERTREGCKVAFEGEASVWSLLQGDPDRYIHAAVRYGAEHELPEEIKAGLDPEQPDLLEKRKPWNKKADPQFALPTEIWREVVARHQRYRDVRAKLAAGEVRDIPDLITLNLDIIRFVQDVIEFSDSPDLIKAFWKALTKVTVLDPTCGSGAFLFAAASILAPLYDLCLTKMQQFVDADTSSKKFQDFQLPLKEHSREYYILKQIIIRNLYGVDIMPEAVEIAKLRLFLKLMAYSQKDDRKPNMGLEPLPDIDFNIRAGNTLVGYATEKAAEDAVKGKLMSTSGLKWADIKVKAEDVDRVEELFRQQQLALGGRVTAEDKKKLRDKLGELDEILNEYLAAEYGIDKAKKPREYAQWKESHQPFHWYVEFHRTMRSGGFDCIIGNPPYVDFRNSISYRVMNYESAKTKNLYSLVIERTDKLISNQGFISYIVPISSISTDGYSTLQNIISEYSMHFSCFDDRPSKLFDGLDKNTLTILILSDRGKSKYKFSTKLMRWKAEERPLIFDVLEYQFNPSSIIANSMPKLGSKNDVEVYYGLIKNLNVLGRVIASSGEAKVFYSRKVNSFLQVLNFTPEVYNGKGELRPPSEFKTMEFRNQIEADFAFTLLNSSIFRWFIDVFSDGSHLNKREVYGFPIPQVFDMSNLANRLSESLLSNSEFRSMTYAHDTLNVQCIVPKKSSDTIHEIDKAILGKMGYRPEIIDYISSYDIKYRMSIGDSDSDE